MKGKIFTWLNELGHDRWIALARGLGVLMAYWLVYFSVGLPVGIGFFFYARNILDEELREVTLHMEDVLLLLHAIAMLLVLLAMVILIMFILKRFDRRRSFSEIGIRSGKRTWLWAILSFVVSSSFIFLIFLAARTAGLVHILETPQEESLWSDILIDLLGYIVLIGAIAVTEELVFRGYIRLTLTQTFSPKTALLISALLFAISRAVMASSGLIGALNSILAGLILGMLFLASGSLWVPIMAHFAWIFVESFIFSFPTSGFTSEGLLRTRIDPGWLMGGNHGPEDGLFTLIAFLVVAIGLWFGTRKRLRAGATLNPASLS